MENEKEQKTKGKITRKWWFWGILILLAIVIIGSAMNMKSPEPEESTVPQSTARSTKSPETTASTVTTEERNALFAAQNYLNTMPFSYQGLVKQLVFSQYSEQAAVYAADHCGADWNEQAKKAAENYLSMMPFSKAELIKQLEFEGYTSEQALFGVTENGY